MPYEVHTEVFDGPFDLLLHLILSEEVDLYEISLAAIVDVYLAELAKMERLDLDIATEFLLIAATLVELKAKRLLPGDDSVDLDDELALWEERDQLLARLLECKTFKDAAVALEALAASAARSYARRAGPEEHFCALAPDPLEHVSPLDLRAAFVSATAPVPVVRVQLDHVAPIRVSVAEAMVEVADEVARAGTITFRGLTEGLAERLDVVVRFLAILELFKQGIVDLSQLEAFGEIQVTWLADSDAEKVAIGAADVYEG